jgi:predicted ArsR family transcriptional regulator
MHAMTLLADREASPREIAAEIGEPVNNVTYHVKQLVELGCVELVRTAPARGGRVVEHFYRSTRRVWVDDEGWEKLGPSERHVFTTTLMKAIANDVNDAMARGTFFEQDDNHLSRTPMVVDAEGWKEVTEVLDAALLSLLEIRSKVAERTGSEEGPGSFPAKIEILQFRAPPAKSP